MEVWVVSDSKGIIGVYRLYEDARKAVNHSLKTNDRYTYTTQHEVK